jgi:hypothetical protein
MWPTLSSAGLGKVLLTSRMIYILSYATTSHAACIAFTSYATLVCLGD